MIEILEYISLNYTWFLIGAIIILLAIIGSYADKTNFGQGKNNSNLDDALNKNEVKEDNDKEVLNESVGYNLNKNKQNEESNNINQIDKNNNKKQKDNNKKQVDETPISIESEIQSEKANDFEESFNKFDQEFEALVPKKDIIDGELLDDIDNLSLDKTQKFNISDIPDLDDVELPKIKNLKTDEKNIWKF